LNIDVIIPAQNEAQSIAKVIADIPSKTVREIIVVNNGSTDATVVNARKAGATVLDEPRKGYGQACLTGLSYVAQSKQLPDIIVFIDGDYSDYPEMLPQLTAPIAARTHDLVIGARRKALREAGSMTLPQAFGNALATTLMRWIYGARFTDLGPFRAIHYPSLVQLNMQDTNFGWTVEMQIKALKQKLRYTELAVPYRRRIGISKVSGTVRGTLMAGYKIILLILKYSLR